ncbi:hypothetical protein PG996_014166, partial [Apiospora saccharicola]
MTQSYSWREAALLAAVAFFGTTQAYQGWPGSNTLVDGEAIRFSQQTWRQHLRHPDAEGEYPVRGYDISQEWPAVQEVDGWRLAVNVSRHIPASEVQNKNKNGTMPAVAVATGFPPQSSPTANSSSSSFMGTSISLKAPETVIHSILGEGGGEVNEIVALEMRSTTWKVCVTIATNSSENQYASSGVSGECDRLPAQCVADFEQAYAEHFAETEDCAGHPPPTPASCGGALDAASLRTIQYPIDAVNGTELYVTASDAHAAAPGNLTAWDEFAASAQLWPVLVVWGWNRRANMNINNHNVENGGEGAASAAVMTTTTKPLAQLSCIKAVGNRRPAPTPTATPTTVPESAARVAVESTTSTWTGLALLTVAL